MLRQSTVRQIFLFGLLILATLAFFELIRGFLMPLFWAVVLAIVFRPVQQRWEAALGDRPSLASALTLVTIILVVVIPLVAVGTAVVRESIHIFEQVQAGEIDLDAPIDFFERMLPTVAGYLDQYGVEIARLRESLSTTALSVSQFLAEGALSFGQNAIQFTVLLFLMLYILFFFLRDGDRYVDALVRAVPLGDVRERWLMGRFAQVSRATIKGTLVVALVQGTLGGLAFWALGIPAAVLWGVLMTVLSLLPAVGSALVWFPAAVILILTGEVLKGIALIAFGTLAIGLVDNFLRPALVSRDTQMPDFLILLTTLGGLTLFGLSGFVIGPIIAAFFLAVWEMFAQEYAEDENPEAVREAATDPNAIPPKRDIPPEDEARERRDLPPASSGPPPVGAAERRA